MYAPFPGIHAGISAAGPACLSAIRHSANGVAKLLSPVKKQFQKTVARVANKLPRTSSCRSRLASLFGCWPGRKNKGAPGEMNGAVFACTISKKIAKSLHSNRFERRLKGPVCPGHAPLETPAQPKARFSFSAPAPSVPLADALDSRTPTVQVEDNQISQAVAENAAPSVTAAQTQLLEAQKQLRELQSQLQQERQSHQDYKVEQDFANETVKDDHKRQMNAMQLQLQEAQSQLQQERQSHQDYRVGQDFANETVKDDHKRQMNVMQLQLQEAQSQLQQERQSHQDYRVGQDFANETVTADHKRQMNAMQLQLQEAQSQLQQERQSHQDYRIEQDFANETVTADHKHQMNAVQLQLRELQSQLQEERQSHQDYKVEQDFANETVTNDNERQMNAMQLQLQEAQSQLQEERSSREKQKREQELALEAVTADYTDLINTLEADSGSGLERSQEERSRHEKEVRDLKTQLFSLTGKLMPRLKEEYAISFAKYARYQQSLDELEQQEKSDWTYALTLKKDLEDQQNQDLTPQQRITNENSLKEVAGIIADMENRDRKRKEQESQLRDELSTRQKEKTDLDVLQALLRVDLSANASERT